VETYLGIDIGGTKIAACLWHQKDQLIKKYLFQAEDYPQAQKLVEDLVTQVSQDQTLSQISAVGISSCGPVDIANGMILSPPNLKGWGNEPLVSMLKKHFSGPVYLENDANAAALAEWHYGYQEKVDSLLYLTFSTGMGSGMILNKKLWSGHSGGAGEVGFMTVVPQGERPGLNGVPGSFEAYTGGKNLAQHYGFKDFKTLCDDVRAGDAAAGDIFEEWLDFCALGIVNLIYVLDPQVIALGTIAVRQPDLVLGPLRKKVQEGLIPSFKNRTRIDVSKIGESIGDYAALVVARNIK